MRDLQLCDSIELLRGDVRGGSRSISRLQTGALVRQVAVDSETDVALTKIDAITTATGQGMGAIARVAQAQTSLEQLTPQASGRLNLLADRHALDVAEVLGDLHHRLRRR